MENKLMFRRAVATLVLAQQVMGIIHTSELKDDFLGALAPDCVFESTYNLMSFQDVQQYPSLHKHLPEVVSASEIAAIGINLKIDESYTVKESGRIESASTVQEGFEGLPRSCHGTSAHANPHA